MLENGAIASPWGRFGQRRHRHHTVGGRGQLDPDLEVGLDLAVAPVTGGPDHDTAGPEGLQAADHLQQGIEHPQVGPVGGERAGGGQIGRGARVDLILDEGGEVELDRDRHHPGAVLDRPLDPLEHRLRAAPAVVPEDLANEGLADPAGHTDPGAVDISTQHRAGTVGAVPDAVAVARTSEVLLDQRQPGEGGMPGVDARIEDGHDHTGAGPRGAVSADRADAPRLWSPPRCRRPPPVQRAWSA